MFKIKNTIHSQFTKIGRIQLIPTYFFDQVRKSISQSDFFPQLETHLEVRVPGCDGWAQVCVLQDRAQERQRSCLRQRIIPRQGEEKDLGTVSILTPGTVITRCQNRTRDGCMESVNATLCYAFPLITNFSECGGIWLLSWTKVLQTYFQKEKTKNGLLSSQIALKLSNVNNFNSIQ